MHRPSHRFLLVLSALLSWGSPAFAGSANLSGSRYHSLLPPDEPKPERAPGPRVVDREVVLEPLEDGLRIHVTWKIATDRPGWYAGTLIGSQYHVEKLTFDQPRLAAHGDGGGRYLYGWIDDDATIEMTAVLDGWVPGAPVELDLMKSILGTVALDSDVFELGLEAGTAAEVGQYWWTGADRLGLRFKRAGLVKQKDRRALITGQSGVGITVHDSEITGQARLAWQILRGEVETVAFTAKGVGADLDVQGTSVRSFARSGNKVIIELQEPTSGRVDVDVTWSQPISGGVQTSVAPPELVPEAFRVETSLQVARAGDQEVVPQLSGWQPRAAADLPTIGRGLIEGAPTAAFVGSGRGNGSIGLYRFEPVSGPPTVVDVAQYTIATSSEGRVLMRALYEVRNERGQWLDVRPPKGMTILGARVGADTALPVAGEGGSWGIPLLRSVETVEGLLTFPVEVAFIGEVQAWDRQEDRTLDLPAVSADVALSRVTLYLPPGYESLLDDNEAGSVPAFSTGDGLAYGFGVGETGAAQADSLFQDAVAAWMDNDFDKAQVALDDLRGIGGENDNVSRLQSNLDLVTGTYAGDADVATSRRIRDQARARGLGDERAAEDLRHKAEEAQTQGDYSGSSAYYEEYLEVNSRLQMLEQDESVEYKALEEKARASTAQNAYFEESRVTASGTRREKKGKAKQSQQQESYSFESANAYSAPVAAASPTPEPQRVVITKNQITIAEGWDADGDGLVDGALFGAKAGEDMLDNNAGTLASRDLFREAVDPAPPPPAVVRDPFAHQYSYNGDAPDTGAIAPEEVVEESAQVYDFTEMEISGELLSPDGAALGGLGTTGTGRGGGGVAVGGTTTINGYGGSVSSREDRKAEARANKPGRPARATAGPVGSPSPSPRPTASTPAPSPPPPPPPMDDDFGWAEAPMEPEAEPVLYDMEEEQSERWEDEDDDERSMPSADRGRDRAPVSVAKRSRSGGLSKKKMDAPADVAYRERDTIELFAEEPDVPEVTATSLSIVVPNLGGETVLYQELLLVAGATPQVVVRAKTSKKDRRNP